MPTPTEVRLKLLRAGFDPIPAYGKRPSLGEWQKMIGVAEHEVQRWERAYPSAQNTGILTRLTPALDIDILDPEAAEAIEQLVRDHYGEHGSVLPRCGQATKRAIPFRTDAPFACASRSTTKTRRPPRAAAKACASPQIPAPITTTS